MPLSCIRWMQDWSLSPRELRVPMFNPERWLAAQGQRQCPRCENTRLRRHFHDASRCVEIDSCPGCAGVWLDAGELERIRELRRLGKSGAMGRVQGQAQAGNPVLH